MTNLSPAAQAVMDACTDSPIHINWATKYAIAAALRAAADEVCLRWAELQHPSDVLNAIATELEETSP